MPRPGWNEHYWKRMDKATQRRLRTTCPRCGSDKTYYNKRFKTWRCGKCEHSFIVQGLGNERPWWKRIFRRNKQT